MSRKTSENCCQIGQILQIFDKKKIKLFIEKNKSIFLPCHSPLGLILFFISSRKCTVGGLAFMIY